MKKLNTKGFTLIELIVVIAILAILAAILVPAIINYVSQANDSAAQANARSLYSEVSIELATLTGSETFDGGAVLIDGCSIGNVTDETAMTSTDLTAFTVTCDGFTFNGREMTP